MKDFPSQYSLKEQDVLYYCHIPKTAGRTVRSILDDQFHYDEVCPATVARQIPPIAPSELQKYRLFRGHLVTINLPELLPGKTIIKTATLREPVSQMVSYYEYIRRNPTDTHYDKVINLSLDEFITHGPVRHNIQTYYIAKTTQFEIDHLSDPEIFEIAKAGLNQFAFVGSIERFQESLFLLSYIFSWRPILNSRKENVAPSRQPYEDVPPATLVLIQDSTRFDQDLYRYAEDLFNQRYVEMQRDLLERYGAQLAPHLQPESVETMTADTLKELLEKNYEQRYINEQKPAVSALDYDFYQPLYGSGWHRRDLPKQGTSIFRWTGPETVSTLDLSLENQADMTVEFRLIRTHAIAPDILDSLRLEVNDQPIELSILYSNKGVKLIQGNIPKALIGSRKPFTRLAFHVNRVMPIGGNKPARHDTRLVGVAINHLQIFPAISEAADELRNSSLQLLGGKLWKEAITFIRQYLQPDERIVLPPLATRTKLPGKVCDYSTALSEELNFQWIVVHKEMLQGLGPTLCRLKWKGFAPVFANSLLVIFAKDTSLPQLGYSSSGVRSLYGAYIKQVLKRWLYPLYARLKRYLKPLYARFIKRSMTTRRQN